MTTPKKKLARKIIKRRRARSDMSKQSTRPSDVSKKEENVNT